VPVTPFHFGVGLAAKGASPPRVSLLIFCATQIAIDCESGYHLWRGDYPIHRTLHTFLGATALCVAVALVLKRALPSARISTRTALLSAALGVLGHVIPDAIMHDDVRPFAPLTDENPFFGLVSLSALHLALVVAGVLGAVLWTVRDKARRGEVARQRPSG
jgi:membrane-bound metal-dependent hydrolase YbcI (DUF457 family)